MRAVLIVLTVLIVVPGSFAGTSAGEVVEQIVAAVNGRAIFLSDLHRYHTFFERGGEAENDSEGSPEPLNRLIDHAILYIEAKRFVSQGPSGGEIDQEMDRIRRYLKGEEAFERRRHQLGISMEELRALTTEILWVKKLIHERIDAFVIILPKETETFYRTHPKRFSGKAKDEAEALIQKILYQEKKMTKKLEYLSRLRGKASIQRNLPYP